MQQLRAKQPRLLDFWKSRRTDTAFACNSCAVFGSGGLTRFFPENFMKSALLAIPLLLGAMPTKTALAQAKPIQAQAVAADTRQGSYFETEGAASSIRSVSTEHRWC